MARWLVKTEPSTYSFAQLQKDGSTTWDGVKNPLALKYLGQIRKGDSVLVYHTGTERAVVGTARASSDAYADPKQKADAKLLVVDLAAGKALPSPITLAAIKANARLAKFPLVRMSRLSVMPVSDDEWREIQTCGAE